MLGSLHLRARACLGSTAVFVRRVSPLLQQGVGSCTALSTLAPSYRQRPFLLQQGAVGPHTDLLTTATPSQIKGCVYLLQYKGLSHTSENRGGDDDVIHLFPAGATVKRLEAAAKHGMFTFGAIVTINCTQQLTERDFEEVLSLSNKKIQSQRTCLRYLNDELWVCELKKPKLDFKVVAGDPEAEMYKLINSKFESSEGPLWRARLMLCGPADPCPVPHLRHQFPHQYNLMLAYHHGANDGLVGLTSIMLILKLLEDLIKDVPVDDKQLGKMVGPSHSEQIEESLKRELEKNPQRLDSLLKDLSNKQFKSLLSEAFGVPEVSQPEMGYIHTVMDTSSVNKFMDKCRSADVTFNSGFTCVINTALVELVREAGLVRDVYSVTSRHAIDERRYWGGNVFKDFGCHMSPMSHTMVTPHNNRQNFWEYAKMFDNEFRGKLRDKYLYQERILRSMNLPKDFTYDSCYATPSPLMYDYYISNMYTPDLSRVGIHDHLRMTDMRHYSVFHNGDFSSFHSIGSLQDRIHYDVEYSTGRMTHETAHRFHDKVISVLDDFANVTIPHRWTHH